MRTRILTALGTSVALLATGTLTAAIATATTGPASAAGGPLEFERVADLAIKPGGTTWLSPETRLGGESDGTFVYVLSGAPLTDPQGGTTALPAGLSVSPDTFMDCTNPPRSADVLVCSGKGLPYVPSPRLAAAAHTADGATVHYAVVYVPPGGDVDEAVREARTAGSRPADTRHAARTVTVRTPEHGARSRVALVAPPVKAGAVVKHTVTLHAGDPGRLLVDIGQSALPATERRAESLELRYSVGDAETAPELSCELHWVHGPGLACDVARPGDYTLSYTVTGHRDLQAWHLDARAEYQVWTTGDGNPAAVTSFQVDSLRKVRDRHRLYARDRSGRLVELDGTGDPKRPVANRQGDVGPGWGGHDQLTKLAPVTGRGTGGTILARDAAGTLWSYGQTGKHARLTPPTKVGGAWKAYRELAGAGDLNGDGRPDLLARDGSGVLWLHPGADATSFGARVKVGGGWRVYDELVGAADVTGDERADLLARDASGALWLYAGTGKGATPFAARKRIADSGWGAYRSVAAPGDLTDDGRPDLVTQDRAGALWLHAGTGKAAAPFAAPVPADAGLVGYDRDAAKAYTALL